MADCLLPQGNSNAVMIKIMNFFIGKGFTPTQACGICGNVWHESKYNPTNENKNDRDSQGRPGYSFGLFQLRDGTDPPNKPKESNSQYGHRFTDMYKYCTKNGLDYRTVDAQLSFVWAENYANFREHYMSHKDMKLEDAVDWWKRKWEVGQGLEERMKAAREAANVYRGNVKTDDCQIADGGGDGTYNEECPPTTLAGEEQATNQPDNSGQRYTMEDTYSPAGNGVMNTKPVLFGGKWAYKMSPYFAKNGEYYAYTVWGGMVSPDSAIILGSVNSKMISSKNIIDHIKTYLLNTNNRPSHIVLTLDSPVIKYKKKGTQKSDVINGLKTAFVKTLTNINASFSTNIYLPLRIDSWDNTFTVNGVECTYEDFNTALKQAANCFWNVKVIETPEFDKGNKRPTNGILPESTWGKYSKEVKTIASNMK